VWSPDGRTLAFIRRGRSNRSHVVLITPSGGAPEKKLAEVAFRRPGFWGPGGAGRLLAWTPDGRWLAVSTMDSPADRLRLVLLSADTGEIKELTEPPRGLAGDVAAAFSPDGRTLAFSRFIDDQQGDLYLQPLSDEFRALGSPRRLTFGNELTLSPVWSADGRHLIFTAGTTARTLRLWRTAVSGGRPQPIDIGYTPVHGVARRGRRVVFTRPMGDISLWVQQLPGDGAARPVADPPTSLISSSWPDGFAQFSPDGRRIAFGSIRSGSREIYLSDRDGSNIVQLTSFGGPSVVHPRWSPDGTRLAFTVTMKGTTEIHTITAAGSPSRSIHSDPALVSETSSDVLNWSRDGRWIYFISRRSGEPQAWKVPAAGGTPIQVTRGGGFAAVESPDGRFVYFLKRPPLTLWQVPIAGGTERHVRDLRGGVELTTAGVYFVKRAVPPPPATLSLLSFDALAERAVAEVEDPGAEFTVSPDGRLLLYARRESTGTDLMLVDNFDVR
jgi:Tol biopolymer transport system component